MLLAAEARKHRALREVPVALVLALVYFILNAEPQNPVQDQRTLWFVTQQDIRGGVGTGAAFLTAVGLPRLVTCERELGTGELIRSSRRGTAYTFGAKLGYAAIYCLACVLLVAALTRRAALTVGLCTLLYVYGVLCNTGMIASLVRGSRLADAAYVLSLLLPTGFITHESFNALYFDPHFMPYHGRGGGGDLGYVWIALLYAFAVTALILFALWRVYRRRDRM